MTMRIRNTIAAFLLMTAFALSGNAQNALSFTRIDRNPRTSAMAGAGIASVQSSWHGAFGNAAQLGFQQGKVYTGVGMQLWELNNEVDKSTNLHAGAGLRFGNFAVALGGAYQMGTAGTQSTYTPNDLLLAIGLAYNIEEVVSIGLNARYATQRFTREAGVNGYSFDLTVIGRITPALSAAVGVGNIGNKVKGSDDFYGQPAYAHGGLAWKPALTAEHSVEVLLDGEYNFDGSFAATLGAEYAYNQVVYARAGYRYASEKAVIPSHLGVGLGLRFGHTRVEASYLTASPILANTINLGVAFNF